VAWVSSRPLDWANESFAITTDPATRYCVAGEEACRNQALEPGETAKAVAVDDAYVRANGPVIRDRLKRAGVRLAHLLDEALGN
jgi:hypothetical protein